MTDTNTQPTTDTPAKPMSDKQAAFLKKLRASRSYDEALVADLIEQANTELNSRQAAVLIDYLVSCEVTAHSLRASFEWASR